MDAKITNFDFEKALLRGIENAGGDIEKDISFITEDQVVALGKKVSLEAQEQRYKYTSFTVEPISDFQHYHGEFTSRGIHLLNKNIRLTRSEALVSKEIFLVPLFGEVGADGYVDYLNQRNFKPCSYAPNYLLGLLRRFDPFRLNMVEGIARRNIVAIEHPEDNFSGVVDAEGHRSFLYTHGREKRLSVVQPWHRLFNSDWCFIAERK